MFYSDVIQQNVLTCICIHVYYILTAYVLYIIPILPI